jgi:hypothetical protein
MAVRIALPPGFKGLPCSAKCTHSLTKDERPLEPQHRANFEAIMYSNRKLQTQVL